MSRVIILDTQDGDWVGVFVDEALVYEGHELALYGASSLLNLSEEFNFTSLDIVSHELVDVDDTELYRNGNLPNTLKELNGHQVYIQSVLHQ